MESSNSIEVKFGTSVCQTDLSRRVCVYVSVCGRMNSHPLCIRVQNFHLLRHHIATLMIQAVRQFLARSPSGFEDEKIGFSSPFTELTSSAFKGMRKLTRKFLKSAYQDLLQIMNDTGYKEHDISLWFGQTQVTLCKPYCLRLLIIERDNDLINRQTPGRLQQDFLIQIYMAQAKLMLPFAAWKLVEKSERNHHAVLDIALSCVREPNYGPATKTAVVVECHKIALSYAKHAKAVRRRRRIWYPLEHDLPPWVSRSDSYLMSESLSRLRRIFE